MRRYEKYKDSGIEWIGEIPEHWESIRLKYIGYLYGGLAGKSANDFNQESNFNNKPFIPFTNICNNKVIDPNQLQQVVIEENEQQNQVAKGDLFFMMSSENFDDVGKSSILLDDLGETYLNSFCKGFRFTKDKYYPPFINYQLLSKAYRSLVLTEANGYTRINLKIDKINDIPLKTPPTLDEQVAIANYLDKKTADIDELIKQKEDLLLLFEEEKKAIINNAVTKGINPDAKLKDSGIDWLGEKPENWEVKKLKYKVKLITEKNRIELQKVGLENIESLSGKYIETNSDFEGEGIHFKVGDILYGKLRPYLAKVFLADFEGAAVGDFFVLRPLKNVLPSYVKYRLLSTSFTEISNSSTYGSKMPRVSWEYMSDLFFAWPDIVEQNEIVQYIENYSTTVNQKVVTTKILIEQLKEYKTALISEVATGKLKVIE